MGWDVVRLFNLRHLLTRRRRTVLTVLGIASSVALIVAISVINETLRNAIDGTTRGLAGEAGLEVTPASGDRLPPGALARLRDVEGVESVVPVSRQITTFRHGNSSRRTFVFGVPDDLATLFPDGLGDVGAQLESPGFFERGILLSQALADDVGAGDGDRGTLRTTAGSAASEVTGVFEHSPFAAVNGGNFALLSLARAQRLFGQGDDVDVAYLRLEPGSRPEQVARSVQRRLGEGAAVTPPGSEATAYQRTFDSIAAISEQARAVAFLVALFLVLNTMSMSLAERRQEVTLLALNGAQRPEIMAAFVIEAVVLGVLGSAVGVLAGVGLGSLLVQQTAANYTILPFVTSGPVIVPVPAVLFGVAAGILVAVGGAVLPARRILRVEPMDALRPEPSYEWSGGRPRRTGVAALAGVVLIACVVAIAGFAPIGSHSWLVGIAFALALAAAALLLPALVPAAATPLRRAYRLLFGMIGRLAGDALLRNPVRATLTAGALALSASVVIAVGSGIGSYNREVDRAASAWYVAPLYVNAPGSVGYRSDQPLPGTLRRGLEGVEGVDGAYPVRFGSIDTGGRQLLLYAMPIAEAAAAGDTITKGVGISQEALVGALRDHEIVMSRYMARRLGLGAGDRFRLPGAPPGTGTRIGGLFNDVAPFDSLYLELADYRRLSGDDSVNRFAIVPEPGTRVGAVAAGLRRYLGEHRVPATVLRRSEMRAEVAQSIDSLFSLAKGIQVAALLIAGLIVLNTMLTATFERRREFGLQRAVGMSRTQLAGSVMLESVAMSAIGAACAVVLGLGLGFLMTLTIENQLAWRMSYVPALLTIFAAVGATLAIGTLAALYPSWRATRRRLIELVRFE